MSAGKPAKGFTIIELLIGIAVLGVLLSLGIPSMRNLVISQRVKTAASDLHVSLTLARSEAIKRNAPAATAVLVEPVDTTNWAKGWSVKVGTETLSTQEAYPNIVFTGPAAAVAYVGTGRVSGVTAAISFTIRSDTATHVPLRCVKIEPSGRPSVRVDADNNFTDGVCG
jgi:type IV fimbrial biogenesis protein FimT